MNKGSLSSRAFAMALGTFLLVAMPVQAQDPASAATPTAAPAQMKKFSFYAGYAFLHTDDGDLHGLSLSPEYRFGNLLSAVVDIGAGKGTLDSASTTITTFLGGLRVRKGVGSASVFIHALAGVARTSASVQPFAGVSISVVDTGLALVGGGGVEFKLSRLKMRIGADYLRREVDVGGGKTTNAGDIRATVGFVF